MLTRARTTELYQRIDPLSWQLCSRELMIVGKCRGAIEFATNPRSNGKTPHATSKGSKGSSIRTLAGLLKDPYVICPEPIPSAPARQSENAKETL